MRRQVFLAFLVYFITNILVASSTFACVGARPLAMGGAFVGVADDENATYWNPAGLTQIEDIRLTYTPTLYDRDTVNYDDFVSLVSPLRFGDQDWGSLGFSFINSGFKITGSEIIDRWYWLSYGAKLPLNLSLGANLRREHYKWKIKDGYYIVNTSVVGPIDDSDDALAVDLSLLWRWEKLSLGLLWQDVNEPEFDLFDDRVKLIAVRNLRPGIAFRPDDKTTFSLEVYDVLGESAVTESNLRVGFERWFDLPAKDTSLAVRLGGYNINADEDENKAITGGLGIKFGPQAFDEVDMDFPITVGIDYTLMHWLDTSPGVSDLTHMLGFSVSVPFDAFGRSYSSFSGKEYSDASNRRYLRRKKEESERDLQKQELKRQYARIEELERKRREQLTRETIIEEPVKKESLVSLKRKKYYSEVYRNINSYLSNKVVPIKGEVNLFFTVREDGEIKDIRITSDEYGLEEILEEILADLPYFPQIPEELEEKEIDFQIKVTFS